MSVGLSGASSLKKRPDITLRVIIADTAVQDLHGIAARVQHPLEARLDRVLFFNAPAERDGAAEKKDTTLVIVQRQDLRSAKSPAVQPYFGVLQQRILRVPVIKVDLCIVALLFKLISVAPHLDIVVGHRAVLEPQERLGGQQTQRERNAQQEDGKNHLASRCDRVSWIGSSHGSPRPGLMPQFKVSPFPA